MDFLMIFYNIIFLIIKILTVFKMSVCCFSHCLMVGVFTVLVTSEHQNVTCSGLETPFWSLLCLFTTSLVVTTVSFYNVP
jgi:hypothetical protein